MKLDQTIRQQIDNLNKVALRDEFVRQNEFLVIDDFLPTPILDLLLGKLPKLETCINRNFIPGHKKGGSISRYDLDRLAPEFGELYRSASFNSLVVETAGRPLVHCPADDPHTYALYYYTKPGDHIGFHYDTCYYRGSRYTVLLGLVDRSSSKLEYRLQGTNETATISLAPGRLVLFNGDKLHHRITPLGIDEVRIALTFEYLTDASIAPWSRMFSNLKDAFAYFGLRQVFGRRH